MHSRDEIISAAAVASLIGRCHYLLRETRNNVRVERLFDYFDGNAMYLTHPMPKKEAGASSAFIKSNHVYWSNEQ